MRHAHDARAVNDNATVIDWSTGRYDVTRTARSPQITDVDRNSGRVDIRASDGSKVQVILPPLAVATTNKGDRASIDVTIGPAR